MVTNFKEGIKILMQRQASSEEIGKYLEQVKEYEVIKSL